MIAVDISVFDSMWSTTHPLADGSPAPSRVSTLLDLSMELVKRYSDFRRPERVPLTERELFWALTGETEQTLREGKLVNARVIWVQQNVAGLVTDNGAVHDTHGPSTLWCRFRCRLGHGCMLFLAVVPRVAVTLSSWLWSTWHGCICRHHVLPGPPGGQHRA